MKTRFTQAVGITFFLLAGMTVIRLYSEIPNTQSSPVYDPHTYPGEWMAYQRAYPYGEIKLESYLLGMHQAQLLHRAADRQRFEWELLGPVNIGGRITDIAVHPNTPYTWYVGAATGGIFKTTDGGENWDNVFEDMPVITIGDLEIDPDNEDVIYAGTGEANASSFSFLGNGMYKSTDAGQSWTHIGLDQSAYIGRVIVDHGNSDRVYAAACGTLFTPDEHRGVYRSTDGGANWEKVLFVSDSTSAIDLIQHPENPDILYAAMWERMRGLNYRTSFGPSSGIYKTLNGGDSWVKLTEGLPSGFSVGRIGLAIGKSNPNVIYAFYDMAYGEVRVYRSSNGGNTWVRKNDGVLQGMNSDFGWYFGQVRVDPNDEDQVYVLGVSSFRSTDGGNNWSEMSGWDFHVDHHALYIDENINLCVEGNDGGLYTSEDYGSSWTKVNNLPITQFYDIEIDDLKPQRIYGGTQDNNTIRTLAEPDEWTALLGGDGFYTVVDYTNSNVIYAEYQWGNLYKSTDGGNNFNYIAWSMGGDRTNWSSPLVMHSENHNILYFGTYRVWKTTNGGSFWTEMSGDLTDGDDGSTFHTISTLAVSQADPDLVLAGTDDGHVHISLDAGSTWQEISEGLPKRWITRVAADPNYPDVIYVTVSGFRWDEPLSHVFRSTDYGQTWDDISGNLPELPANTIAIDPDVDDRYFVGTDAGLFLTEDGGSNWYSISAGLGNVPVTSLKIHSDTRTLVAGTYGLSAYKIDMDDIYVGIGKPETAGRFPGELSVYPNPGTIRTVSPLNVSFSLEKSTVVDLAVYDSQGKKVADLFSSYCTAGTKSFTWDKRSESGSEILPGLYFVRLKAGHQGKSVKLLML
jgi:photosystem II stability/assembly factor-like uncharacterized protein